MANEFKFEDFAEITTFNPASKQVIAKFASEQHIEFSPDYAAFMNTYNGFYFDLEDADPLAEGIETFDYVRCLFGVDTNLEYNDTRVYLARASLWPNEFRVLCYPIAESVGGDLIVQVFKGAAKGKVFFVDHEVIPEFDELAEAGVNLENADDVLSYLVNEQGCFIEVATSFSNFIAKLVVYDDDGIVQVSIRRPLSANDNG